MSFLADTFSEFDLTPFCILACDFFSLFFFIFVTCAIFLRHIHTLCSAQFLMFSITANRLVFENFQLSTRSVHICVSCGEKKG